MEENLKATKEECSQSEKKKDGKDEKGKFSDTRHGQGLSLVREKRNQSLKKKKGLKL